MLRIIEVILVISAFRNDYRDIKTHLIKALELVATLAFMNYILIMFVPNIFVKIIRKENNYTVETFLYLFNMLPNVYYNISGVEIFRRNQGIYWEPGVMQAPMNILIYYLLIECKYKINRAKLPIFIVISTFSTTGYILLALILFLKFRVLFFSRRALLKKIAVIMVILIFLPFLIGEIKHKFYGSAKESSIIRMYDYFVTLKIIQDNFLLGVGINYDNYVDKRTNVSIKIGDTSYTYGERGSTNSITTIFVYFGFPLGALIIFALYKQNIFSGQLAFFILIFFILFTEPIGLSQLTCLFLLSAIPIRKTTVLHEKYK
jgi:hypothetical protein